jgi:hypothetical protein
MLQSKEIFSQIIFLFSILWSIEVEFRNAYKDEMNIKLLLCLMWISNAFARGSFKSSNHALIKQPTDSIFIYIALV